MAENTTRERLIDIGLRAMLEGGYDGVGIGPILAEAGVPKGSFYYFFQSKEAFACAVLETYSERYRERLVTLLTDGAKKPREPLENYFAALEGELRREGPFGGCLYGMLAQTLAARGDRLRIAVRECFATWQSRLGLVLGEAEAAGDLVAGVDPQEGAAFLIEAYEGALIRMKAEGNFEPFERFKSYALNRLFN